MAGIEVDEAVRTPFTEDISKDGTAIALLHKTRDRHVLVVLGSSERALAAVVALFGTGGFQAGLVDELVGVYETR